MNSARLLPVLEVPAAHARQAFAYLWGAEWYGMIITYGFWGLLIAGLFLVIRRPESVRPALARLRQLSFRIIVSLKAKSLGGNSRK